MRSRNERRDETEILLKVVLSTISISPEYSWNTASWAIVSQPIKKNILISNQGGQMVMVVDLIPLPLCGSRSDFHVKCQGFPILLKLDLHTCSLFSISCLLVAAPTRRPVSDRKSTTITIWPPWLLISMFFLIGWLTIAQLAVFQLYSGLMDMVFNATFSNISVISWFY
jgi:hypothetical protein